MTDIKPRLSVRKVTAKKSKNILPSVNNSTRNIKNIIEDSFKTMNSTMAEKNEMDETSEVTMQSLKDYMKLTNKTLTHSINLTNERLLHIFHYMEGRFNTMDKSFTFINEHMINVNKYMKTESDFQEIRDRTFIATLYMHNFTSRTVISIPIKKFFTKKGTEITDFDGLLFCTTTPTLLRESAIIEKIEQSGREENIARETAREKTIEAYKETLLPNNVVDFKAEINEYILIESKHSLWKGKIDSKMRQLHRVNNVFRLMQDKNMRTLYADDADNADNADDADDADDDNLSDVYIKMMNTITNITHHDHNHLTYPITVLFSSDDIPVELVAYIDAINKGMTEEIYDKLTYTLYQSDTFIDLDTVLSHARVPKLIKSQLIHAKTMKEIRDIFQKINGIVPPNEYLQAYLIPYSELHPFFHPLKSKIGVSQFNKCTFFAKNTLNV
jgi:hypothetical protein